VPKIEKGGKRAKRRAGQNKRQRTPPENTGTACATLGKWRPSNQKKRQESTPNVRNPPDAFGVGGVRPLPRIGLEVWGGDRNKTAQKRNPRSSREGSRLLGVAPWEKGQKGPERKKWTQRWVPTNPTDKLTLVMGAGEFKNHRGELPRHLLAKKNQEGVAGWLGKTGGEPGPGTHIKKICATITGANKEIRQRLLTKKGGVSGTENPH